MDLPSSLVRELQRFRDARTFNVEQWVLQKVCNPTKVL